MKKIIIVFLMMFLLTGCSNTEINGTSMQFIDINNHLVYDSYTHVVYINNYTYYGNMVRTPYYDTNGNIVIYDGENINFDVEHINDLHVYDLNTHIVYIENYTYYGNNVYTPYYDQNGKTCKYDVESNKVIPICNNTEISIE